MGRKIVWVLVALAVVIGTNVYQASRWDQERQRYDAKIISLQSEITGMGFERIQEAKRRVDRLEK